MNNFGISSGVNIKDGALVDSPFVVNFDTGSGATPPPAGTYIITETSDYVVTEAGDRTITE